LEMFLILFLAWIFLLPPVSTASKVSVCTAVRQSGYITTGSMSATDAIANFTLDLSASFNANNESFRNILTVTNFMEWYKDTTIYQRVSPWSLMFFENPNKQILCESMNNCTVNFPNGLVEYYYKFSYQNYQDQWIYVFGPQVYVADGTFFNGEDANLWDPTNPFCMNEESAYGVGVSLWRSTCCIKFDDVEIPDSSNGLF
jgi:hypothetical protein